MSFLFQHPLLPILFLFASAAVPFLLAIGVLNLIRRRRDRVRSAWLLVREETARRHELVPDLLARAGRFADRMLLDEVYVVNQHAMKNAELPAKEADIEDRLARSLKRILMYLENIPALRSDALLADVVAKLHANEERIQGAIRYYNALVKDHNESLETFPANFVASLLGVPDEDYLTISEVDADLRVA